MDKYYKRMQPLLGTFVEIGIIANINSERFVSEAFEAIKQIHEKLSFHKPDSELNLLNNSHGKELELAAITIKILRLAKALGELSDNKFNCTIGNCFKVTDNTTLLVQNSARSGTSDDIVIKGNKAKLTQGIALTLDGIAKGFAVDLAVRSLKKNGVNGGWVNAGGDLKVFGSKKWPIQLATLNSTSRPVLYLQNMAIATSSYSAENDSRFPAKIISTSLQKVSNFGTWSIIAKSAWRADALTKVAANSNSIEREKIIKKLGGILVDTNKDLS